MTSNRDRILNLYKKLSTNSENEWFSIADGETKEVRILSMILDHSVGSHWGILKGKDGKNGGTIRCPAVWSDGVDPCPVCELVAELYNEGDKEKADQLKARTRAAMVVLDLSKDDGVARIWESPFTVFKAIKGFYASGKYGDIMSLKEGRNLEVSRFKQGKKVEYSVLPDPNITAIDFDMSKAPNLEEVLKPGSYEDILYAVENGEFPKKERDDEEDEDEIEEKVEKARKPSAYSKGLPATKTRDEKSEIQRLAEEAETEEEAPQTKAPLSARARLQDKIANMRKSK